MIGFGLLSLGLSCLRLSFGASFSVYRLALLFNLDDVLKFSISLMLPDANRHLIRLSDSLFGDLNYTAVH